MSLLRKIQEWLYRFMQGRNGVDNLGWAALIAAFVLNLLNMFIGSLLLSLLSTGLYVYSIFRMFSRNRGQRNLENKRFVQWTANWRKEMKEFFLRVKNLPTYKYFRCPKCSVRLRMKRGSAEKDIHCPKCHHEFTKKA